MKHFNTAEDALAWVEIKADDSCIDNFRFAFCDDDNGMMIYENQKSHGCCGYIDIKVMVSGRQAMVGCNYGH